MGEVYAATYCFEQPQVAHAVGVGGPWLLAPAAVLPALVALVAQWAQQLAPPPSHSWAGNVWADAVLAPQLGFDAAQQARCTVAWPSAAALLRLAPALWATGQAVAAAELQPLYVRDKVAQTTAERATAVPPLKSASTSTSAER
jgi:tRNA threonylcarbamoyladenosine biosynthesis protein TsaB